MLYKNEETEKIKYQVATIKPIRKSIQCTYNHEPQIKAVSKKNKDNSISVCMNV
jgi:hypothetical protein